MDLVERLRTDADAWNPKNTSGCPVSKSLQYTVDLEREAADELERQAAEIERLRATVKKVVDWFDRARPVVTAGELVDELREVSDE